MATVLPPLQLSARGDKTWGFEETHHPKAFPPSARRTASKQFPLQRRVQPARASPEDMHMRDYHSLLTPCNPYDSQYHQEARLGFRRPRATGGVRLRPMDEVAAATFSRIAVSLPPPEQRQKRRPGKRSARGGHSLQPLSSTLQPSSQASAMRADLGLDGEASPRETPISPAPASPEIAQVPLKDPKAPSVATIEAALHLTPQPPSNPRPDLVRPGSNRKRPSSRGPRGSLKGKTAAEIDLGEGGTETTLAPAKDPTAGQSPGSDGQGLEAFMPAAKAIAAAAVARAVYNSEESSSGQTARLQPSPAASAAAVINRFETAEFPGMLEMPLAALEEEAAKRLEQEEAATQQACQTLYEEDDVEPPLAPVSASGRTKRAVPFVPIRTEDATLPGLSEAPVAKVEEELQKMADLEDAAAQKVRETLYEEDDVEPPQAPEERAEMVNLSSWTGPLVEVSIARFEDPNLPGMLEGPEAEAEKEKAAVLDSEDDAAQQARQTLYEEDEVEPPEAPPEASELRSKVGATRVRASARIAALPRFEDLTLPSLLEGPLAALEEARAKALDDDDEVFQQARQTLYDEDEVEPPQAPPENVGKSASRFPKTASLFLPSRVENTTFPSLKEAPAAPFEEELANIIDKEDEEAQQARQTLYEEDDVEPPEAPTEREGGGENGGNTRPTHAFALPRVEDLNFGAMLEAPKSKEEEELERQVDEMDASDQQARTTLYEEDEVEPPEAPPENGKEAVAGRKSQAFALPRVEDLNFGAMLEAPKSKEEEDLEKFVDESDASDQQARETLYEEDEVEPPEAPPEGAAGTALSHGTKSKPFGLSRVEDLTFRALLEAPETEGEEEHRRTEDKQSQEEQEAIQRLWSLDGEEPPEAPAEGGVKEGQ